MSTCFFCGNPNPCDCLPGSEGSEETKPKPIVEPFPCEYIPNFLSQAEADALFNHFLYFDACHLPNPYNDNLLNTRSISYCADPEHSQAIGGYDKPGKPRNAAQIEEEEHCHGPRVPSSQAPQCIRDLQVKLNDYLHAMPGYDKLGRSGKFTHNINYLSIMHYPDENAGIGWHKHGEDNGCDTPVLLLSMGALRDFYLGKIVKRGKPKDGPDVFWRQPMEHGSLIVMPDAMNYTHWHAILKNTPANQKKYGVTDMTYGPRISINTKCLRSPRVFSLKGRHPRHGVYVGCAGPWKSCICHAADSKAGSMYGNSYRPFDADCHSKNPVSRGDEATFRKYVEEKMLNPAFRAQAIKELRGKHLLCWCIQDGPGREAFCHARVWLEVVNR